MGCRIFLGLSTSVSSWRSFLSSPTLSSRYCLISWIKTCIYLLYLGCAALFEARNQHRSWGDKSFGEWMSWGFSLSPQWRWLQHWMMTYPTYQFALNLPWGKIQNLNLGKTPKSCRVWEEWKMDEWENPENLDLWKKVFGCKRILIQWN